MVADENKYWFENDDRPGFDSLNKEPSNDSAVSSSDGQPAEKEDLFGSENAFSGAGNAPSAEKTNAGASDGANEWGRYATNAEASPSGAPTGASWYEGSFSSPTSVSSPSRENAGDPHERHYQSDFAKRGKIPESDLNKNGQIKALRGSMLKKLLKYDYRALFKFLLPCYIVMFSLAVVVGISFLILKGSESVFAVRIFTSMVTLYVISVVVCLVLCEINIPVRFHKNLFSGEGYLTLSIPATPEEHIFSKLISGFTTVLLTFVVALVSAVIVFLASGELTFSEIGYFFRTLGQLIAGEPVSAIFYIIEILLLIPIVILVSLQIFQCCICIGQMFTKRNRIAMAVGVYLAFYAILQIVFVWFAGTFVEVIDFFASLGGHGLMWFFIVLLAGVNVGAFFIQRHVLKKKVNLA